MAIESSDGETLDSVKRLDTTKLLIQAANDDGSVRDITSDTLIFEARLKVADSTPLISKTSNNPSQIDKVNPVQGKAHIYIMPIDTQGITKNTVLQCQLEIVDSSGVVDTTMFALPVTYRQ